MTETPVFRFGVFGPSVSAIDDGPDWLVIADAETASPIYLASYGSPWTGWTNASAGSIDASVDQSRYPATADQVKWGQYQTYPAYTTHDPITCTVAGLEPGAYKVVVYAREHWAPFTSGGERVFTISANGGEPVTVDLVADFGPLTLGAITLDATVDGTGVLDVTFVGAVEAPTWDSIEILRVEGGTNGNASGAVISAAASVIPAAASGGAGVPGTVAAAAASLVAGVAAGTRNPTVAGVVITAAASVRWHGGAAVSASRTARVSAENRVASVAAETRLARAPGETRAAG